MGSVINMHTRQNPEKKSNETTDLALNVRTSNEDMTGWDRSKIVDALMRETGLDRQTSDEVSLDVEEVIKKASIKCITAPLIRELVDSKLIERGLEDARKKHTRLGVPIYDVDQLILHPNKENANVPHGPEATNLTLAEGIKKEYALLRVFSPEIGDAHMRGDIHLHDLGFIDRPYCSGQSLEYIKKFGLSLPNSLSIAKPAKQPEVLLAHMVKFAAALQSHFAGAIGWDAVNLFFAPYLEGRSDREVRQLAQMMVYEFSQQAVARGGQAIFTDINLYWEVPKHFENVPAIGPGGVFTGRTYGDYEKEAQRFVWFLFDVYREGDGTGRPFFFPKPLVHITEKFFRTEGHQEFLEHICDIASEKGTTYFVFDRGDTAKISECCRLSFKLNDNDLNDAKEPWKMRFCALQNVTVNLPRLAYTNLGNEEALFSNLSAMIELAVKAHLEKKIFIEKLLALGESGPLALLTMKTDGQPYIRMHRASYLIGMVGLNEMVQAFTGEELNESKRALKFGLKVIAHMNLECQRFAKKHGIHFVLEQTPAESTSYRFARLDLRDFGEIARQYVRGTIDSGEIYYTNSTCLPVSSRENPIERVISEGLFHPIIEAGSITHIWLGESKPSKQSLANFVVKVFRETLNDQIAFSPEFTNCLQCGRTVRGLLDACPRCGAQDADGITRMAGKPTGEMPDSSAGAGTELTSCSKNRGFFARTQTGSA